MTDEDALDRDLRELSLTWAAGLAGKMQALEEAARPLLGGDHARPALEAVHVLVHRLAGSGATFGFPGVTRAARRMESSVEGLLAAARAPSGDEIAAFRSHLEAVQSACSAVASAGPDAQPRASGTM